MIFSKRNQHIGEYLSQGAFASTLAVKSRNFTTLPASPLSHDFFSLHALSRNAIMLAPRKRWSGQWPMSEESGRRIETQELSTPEENVGLRGSFSRFDLIAEFADLIRNDWLILKTPPAVRPQSEFLICVGCGGHMADKGAKIDAEDLVAVREDAVLRAASRLTEGEIRRLVAKMEHTELHWLVDDPDDPMLRRLLDLGGVVHCRGGMEDFRLIHSFQKVAIGQSAFQWWAAFLGAAREIYFPPIDRGIWSHPEPADLITDPWWWGIDLRVPGDGRYIYEW